MPPDDKQFKNGGKLFFDIIRFNFKLIFLRLDDEKKALRSVWDVVCLDIDDPLADFSAIIAAGLSDNEYALRSGLWYVPSKASLQADLTEAHTHKCDKMSHMC